MCIRDRLINGIVGLLVCRMIAECLVGPILLNMCLCVHLRRPSRLVYVEVIWASALRRWPRVRKTLMWVKTMQFVWARSASCVLTGGQVLSTGGSRDRPLNDQERRTSGPFVSSTPIEAGHPNRSPGRVRPVPGCDAGSWNGCIAVEEMERPW